MSLHEGLLAHQFDDTRQQTEAARLGMWTFLVTEMIPELRRRYGLSAERSATVVTGISMGGLGSLRGVLVGAVLFTALPEVLRLAPTWRLVIYGSLLLVIVIRSPGGLEGLLRHPARAR